MTLVRHPLLFIVLILKVQNILSQQCGCKQIPNLDINNLIQQQLLQSNAGQVLVTNTNQISKSNVPSSILQQTPSSQQLIPSNINALQLSSQPLCQKTDIPLVAVLNANGQLSLQNQVSHGTPILAASSGNLLANYGTRTILDNSAIVPGNTNNFEPISNIPFNVIDQTQLINSLPVSVQSSLISDIISACNPTQITFTNVPSALSSQNAQTSQPNQIVISLQNSSPCPEPQQQVNVESKNQIQPFRQSQPTSNYVSNQPSAPNSKPVQNPPFNQNQGLQYAAQPSHSVTQNLSIPPVQNQQSLSSILLSYLMQSEDDNLSSNNPANIPGYQKPKSTMKSMIPLLFNLLTDRNECPCRPKCNCNSCKNCGCNMNYNGPCQDPTAFGPGYPINPMIPALDQMQAPPLYLNSEESDDDFREFRGPRYTKMSEECEDSNEIYYDSEENEGISKNYDTDE